MEGGRVNTDLPSITQGNHVVNVDVAGSRPCSPVVGTEPTARRRSTCGVRDDVCAVALEHRLARVASTGLSNPVGEQIAGVAVLRALGGDGEAGEEGCSGGFAGDVGRSAGIEDWCWGCGDKSRGGYGDEDRGLHAGRNGRYSD